MSAKLGTFLLILVAVFLADQASKRYAVTHLGVLERRPILGQQTLVLSRYSNRGVLGERYTRYVPTVIWILILMRMLARLSRAQRGEILAFSFLLAGGFSNIWDHWQGEFVVDPLQLSIGQGRFVPFNLADISVCLGGLAISMILLYEMIRRPVRRRPLVSI